MENVGWVEILDYMKTNNHNDMVMGIIIKFLFDVYRGPEGWKIKDLGWHVVIRLTLYGGGSHSYSFSKSVCNYSYSTPIITPPSVIIPFELENEDDSVDKSFYSPLSTEFTKFIIQNMDKLNPNYKDGDISFLRWKQEGY